MPRIVKDPEERRHELLAVAMRLFAEKGYDNVSVRAVARAAGVAPGLSYHYFDSKQSLFAAAIEHYAARCAAHLNEIMDDTSLGLDDQLEQALAYGADHEHFPYASFFHAEGSDALHDRLSLGICEAVRPHLRAALERDAAARGRVAHDADAFAAFMVYGCIGPASRDPRDGDAVAAARRCLRACVEAFRSAEGGARDGA